MVMNHCAKAHTTYTIALTVFQTKVKNMEVYSQTKMPLGHSINKESDTEHSETQNHTRAMKSTKNYFRV